MANNDFIVTTDRKEVIATVDKQEIIATVGKQEIVAMVEVLQLGEEDLPDLLALYELSKI